MSRKLEKVVEAFSILVFIPYIYMFTVDLLNLSLFIVIISYISIFIFLIIIAVRGSKKRTETHTGSGVLVIRTNNKLHRPSGEEANHSPGDQFPGIEKEVNAIA